MNIKLQIMLIVGCIFILASIINMIRKEKLDLKYSLIWIIVDIGIIFMSIFPDIIDLLALLIGVATPINIIFFFGIVFQIIIIFSLTGEQSRSAKKIKELAQNIALLEEEIHKERNK
jgi:hypothetical protein